MVDDVFVYEQQQLQVFAAAALEHARTAGADEAAVRLGESETFSLNVRNGDLDSFQHRRHKQIAITVYIGERSGSSYSSDLSDGAVREATAAAVAIARQTGTDPYAGVISREDLAKEFPDLDLYHPWQLDTPSALEIARELESLSLQWPGQSLAAALFPEPPDAALASSGAGVSTSHGQSFFATSQGLSQGQVYSYHGLSCDVFASTDQGMQAGQWWSDARSRSGLLTAGQVGGMAAFRATRGLGGRRLKSCDAPVLFEAPVAQSLFGHLFAAISGGAQYRNQSYLPDSLNTSVMAAHIDIGEYPHEKSGPVSASFDAEGVATRERLLVSEGVLQSYLLDAYAARRLGLALTGNAGGARNVRISSRRAQASDGLGELLRTMDRGLLVTDILGGGVNPVTGDYSQGVAGFWVEQGVICYPVEDITIAGNLHDIFHGIQAIGRDELPGAAVRCGSVLVEHMRIAGL